MRSGAHGLKSDMNAKLFLCVLCLLSVLCAKPLSAQQGGVAMPDPKHPDHTELTAWYDECCGGIFNPETIDEFVTKRRVAAIAIRRAAGKAAYAKRQAS